MIGRALNHFRIDAKLGEGGMGVVYRATDEKLRREVALKVLPESLAADPERRSRFLREARAAAAVTHNNIATVYEVGEADGHVFIAMELVPGETLRERMAPGLSHAEATRIAKEIARGLARAHEKGIVHRDLKPENVMITPDGDVKILDFGLAKLLDLEPTAIAADAIAPTGFQATAEGRIMGTPAYMSPEQAEGRGDIDARSDVFSFGAMLYEMLAGVAPFQGVTSVAILYHVLHREPEPLAADLPLGIAAVVSRCLKKARDERFATGRDILVALDPEPGWRVSDAPSGNALPAVRAATPSGMGTALGATIAADAEPGTAAAPAPREKRPAATRSTVIGVVALMGLALGASSAWRKRVPASPAVSSSASSAKHATTLADLPLPESAKPEALTEYRAGMQLMRDDSYLNALHRFEKAAALDPSMALAHLRIAELGTSFGGAETTRAELARAAELRAQLGERERLLLDAVEPIVGRIVPDEALGVARLKAAHERFPLDEEFLRLLAEFTLDDSAQGPVFARAATELDPQDAAAWECLGRSLAVSGDLAGGRTALEHCAEVSTESSDCHVWLLLLDGAAGRCAEMEHEAARETDGDSHGNKDLAMAFVALGRPEAMVQETLARYVAWEPADVRSIVQGLYDAKLASLSGHFGVSLARLDEVTSALATNSSRRREIHRLGSALAQRVEVLRETGDESGARAAAREFTDRVELLTHGIRGSGGDIGRYWWIVRAASMPLDPGRRDWLGVQDKSGAQKATTWIYGWALPSTTREEASAALAAAAGLALPRGGESMDGPMDGDEAAGHVFVLAGKPAEAIPYLQRATHNCFALEDPIEHVHAILDLGVALEETHDKAGACVAYGKVLTQWGYAKPRSISAEAARDGMRRLGCAQ